MATPAILDPPPMYRVRPYFEIKKVKLPDCMYLMKPLHELPSMTTSDEVRRGQQLVACRFSF